VRCEPEVTYEEIRFGLNHRLNRSGVNRFLHATTGNDNDRTGDDRSIANPVEEELDKEKSVQDAGLSGSTFAIPCRISGCGPDTIRRSITREVCCEAPLTKVAQRCSLST
jgi:hypothetical protein